MSDLRIILSPPETGTIRLEKRTPEYLGKFLDWAKAHMRPRDFAKLHAAARGFAGGKARWRKFKEAQEAEEKAGAEKAADRHGDNLYLPDPRRVGKEYRKTATIHAVKIDKPFKVRTMEGVVEGRGGDWHARANTEKGEEWPIEADVFEKTYRPVSAAAKAEDYEYIGYIEEPEGESAQGKTIKVDVVVPVGDMVEKGRLLKPFPNEHAARQRDPEQYERFRRTHPDGWPEGVDAIWGVQDEGAEKAASVRPIRFDLEKRRRRVAMEADGLIPFPGEYRKALRAGEKNTTIRINEERDLYREGATYEATSYDGTGWGIFVKILSIDTAQVGELADRGIPPKDVARVRADVDDSGKMELIRFEVLS